MAVIRDTKLVSKILYMHQIESGIIACDMQEFFADASKVDNQWVVLKTLDMRTIQIPPNLVAKYGLAPADAKLTIWGNTKHALYLALLEMGELVGVEG